MRNTPKQMTLYSNTVCPGVRRVNHRVLAEEHTQTNEQVTLYLKKHSMHSCGEMAAHATFSPNNEWTSGYKISNATKQTKKTNCKTSGLHQRSPANVGLCLQRALWLCGNLHPQCNPSTASPTFSPCCSPCSYTATKHKQIKAKKKDISEQLISPFDITLVEKAYHLRLSMLA